MELRLDFTGFDREDYENLALLLVGKPVDGSLADWAPGVGVETTKRLHEAMAHASASGAVPGSLVFELTADPAQADAVFDDLSMAWAWCAVVTAALRFLPLYARACKPLEQLGRQLLPEIAKRGYDTASALAIMEGRSGPEATVEDRKRILNDVARQLRRRAKQHPRDDSDEA